jgi:hypothetical protein
MTPDPLSPAHAGPADLTAIEAVPPGRRARPAATAYDVLHRAVRRSKASRRSDSAAPPPR